MHAGFIGLGIMGSAMAANLLKAGHSLTIWNRSPGKCGELVSCGAKMASSPREVAERSEITCVMMAAPDAVESVRVGVNGIMAGLSAGKGYIDMSTVDAGCSVESARMTREKGALFLEAPVAGSRKPAEDGTLTIMAAGDKALFDMGGPLFAAMGKKVLYLGERIGDAANMKLANNLVMCGALTALAEGVALASKTGLDPLQLLEVLDSGAVSNPMFRLKGGPMAANGEFPAAFPLKHMQKDLRLALRQAEESGQPLFAAAVINELYKKAVAEGLGESDFSAISMVVSGITQKG